MALHGLPRAVPHHFWAAMMLLVRWRDYDRVAEGGMPGGVRTGEPHQGRLHSFVSDGHGDIIAMVLEGSRFVEVPYMELEISSHSPAPQWALLPVPPGWR